MTTAMTRSIRTELSTRSLRFEPGGEPTTFEVTVYNESDIFASFQPELQAPGVDQRRGPEWYRLVPAVSSKIPSGDCVKFLVEIFGIPPVPGGFSGVMRLTTRVYSPELRDADVQDLRLSIEGTGMLPPQLQLLAPPLLKVKPGESLRLELTVKNPNRKLLTTTLCLGLGTDSGEASEAAIQQLGQWFPDGLQKLVTLQPGQELQLAFSGQVPGVAEAPSDNYPVTIAARQPMAPEVSVQTIVRVLPAGFFAFRAEPLEQRIPDPPYRWLNPPEATATYTLTFDNHSNVAPLGQIEVYDPKTRQPKPQWNLHALTQPLQAKITGHTAPAIAPVDAQADDEPEAAQAVAPLDEGLALEPAKPLAIDQPTPFTLQVHRKLPWLGWSRLQKLEAKASLVSPNGLSDPAAQDLEIQNAEQTLELQVLPVIPFWLQIAGGLALIFLTALLLMLRNQGHTAPIKAVQFNGQATQVISGSDDQTVRLWNVKGDRLRPKGILTRFNKAVREARYRPFNNNEVVAALENGEVKILNLLTGQFTPLGSSRSQDDRAFDAVFSRDARTLFTGHGSGAVRIWGLDPGSQPTPLEVSTGFAIRALALVGDQERYLAVAGRYNQLKLVDLGALATTEKAVAQTVPYTAGGSEAYIMSLATAEQVPALLATADNQGKIALWDIGACLQQGGGASCQPLDEWSGHGGTAVYGVALSADGCYLASAGDDGRTMLWPLTSAGKRKGDSPEGRRLERSSQRLNAVDVVRTRDRVLVASGGDDRRVRLASVRVAGQCR